MIKKMEVTQHARYNCSFCGKNGYIDAYYCQYVFKTNLLMTLVLRDRQRVYGSACDARRSWREELMFSGEFVHIKGYLR